jgi:2-oxoisovalerate dehydrogenase E1 component alpha subunit
LIEWVTYRAAAHSTSDDPSKYRPRDEYDAWPLGDPIQRLKKHLVSRQLWDEDRHSEMEKELKDEVKDAAKEAESHGTLAKGPVPGTGKMFNHVYKEMPAHLVKQRKQAGV